MDDVDTKGSMESNATIGDLGKKGSSVCHDLDCGAHVDEDSFLEAKETYYHLFVRWDNIVYLVFLRIELFHKNL
jgi:hypothetical protein